MDPLTMMIASIGMQFFNNYATNKKNSEIQAKQREFQKALAEQDFERMRRLQSESAKLALEMETEVHQQREKDINDSYDTLIDNFAHSFTIQNWPLNVLPFIMKGESFGSLFHGHSRSVNLHCLFTPSNCDWFNCLFYDDIDLQLEAAMNEDWNTQTTHPVVYYGGAWNRRSNVRGISTPNVIDLDDIELLQVNLKDIPVVVITPYFDPWLHFKVKIWGMGQDLDSPFRIDIPHGENLEHAGRVFTYDYHKEIEFEETEEFLNTTISEFVTYLENMIGFIADKYFWNFYGIHPQLPDIVSDNPDKCNFFLSNLADKYKLLPLENLDNSENFCKAVDFIGAMTQWYEHDECNQLCMDLHDRYVELYGGEDYLDIPDLDFLEKVKKLSKNAFLTDRLNHEITSILENERIPMWFCANTNEFYQRILNTRNGNRFNDCRFVYRVLDGHWAVGSYIDDDGEKLSSVQGIRHYVILFHSICHKGTYEVNLHSMSVSAFDRELGFLDLDANQLRYLYDKKEAWFQSLVRQDQQIHQMVSAYLENARILNLDYDDLVSWSQKHNNGSSQKTNFILAYNIEKLSYYIIGLTEDMKHVFASYCHTVDDYLVQLFGNKLVLAIK